MMMMMMMMKQMIKICNSNFFQIFKEPIIQLAIFSLRNLALSVREIWPLSKLKVKQIFRSHRLRDKSVGVRRGSETSPA